MESSNTKAPIHKAIEAMAEFIDTFLYPGVTRGRAF